jgi:hypothetical protein
LRNRVAPEIEAHRCHDGCRVSHHGIYPRFSDLECSTHIEMSGSRQRVGPGGRHETWATEAVGPAGAAQDLPATSLGGKRTIELVEGHRCLHRGSSLGKAKADPTRMA